MQLHDKTQAKIKKLLDMGWSFLERYESIKTPDIIFIVSSFEDKFQKINQELMMKKFNADNFHDSIYDFDNVVSAWMGNLTYRIETEEKSKNGIYDVLFSVLQGIDNLIDEDHFAWEEDEDHIDESDDEYEEEEYSDTSDDDEMHEHEPDYERSFPD